MQAERTVALEALLKVGQRLRSMKDSLGLHVPGVYKIPSSCGGIYIGQTGRSIEVRWKEEHRRYLCLGQTEKFALAQYGCCTGNAISFNETQIVANNASYDV